MASGIDASLDAPSQPIPPQIWDDLPTRGPPDSTVLLGGAACKERGNKDILYLEIHRLLAEQTDRVLYRLDAIASQIQMCSWQPVGNEEEKEKQLYEQMLSRDLQTHDDMDKLQRRQSESSLQTTVCITETEETATRAEMPTAATQKSGLLKSGSISTIQSSASRFAIQRTDKMMKRLFEIGEEQEILKYSQLDNSRWKYTTVDGLETMIDSLMAVVICLNGLFIGISMDYSSQMPNTFLVMDIIFTCVFIAELVLKVVIKGFCGHFCGEGSYSNCFDAAIIFIDFMQLSLVAFLPGAAENLENLPSASLLRMIRLVKLARIIRLLRSDVFKDLLTMIRGLIGGVTVLLWSIVLFLMVLYVVSLVYREALGRDPYDNVYEYFDSVPRAMYTTFRCSFGDCSTAGGVPIFEQVHLRYGAVLSVFHCAITFVVSIGLFNVISAIFVESTITARDGNELSKMRARMDDEVLWSTKVTILVRKLLACSPKYANMVQGPNHRASFVDNLSKLVMCEIDSSALDTFIKDPVVISSLAELDIDPEDNVHLSDIFDPDNGGTICIRDFIDGLRRLRGKTKRSDIVAVDLMIRNIQLQIADMNEFIPQILEAVRGKKTPQQSTAVIESVRSRACQPSQARPADLKVNPASIHKAQNWSPEFWKDTVD